MIIRQKEAKGDFVKKLLVLQQKISAQDISNGNTFEEETQIKEYSLGIFSFKQLLERLKDEYAIVDFKPLCLLLMLFPSTTHKRKVFDSLINLSVSPLD